MTTLKRVPTNSTSTEATSASTSRATILQRLWAPASLDVRNKLYLALAITLGGFLALLLARSLAVSNGEPGAFSLSTPSWITYIAVLGRALIMLGGALWVRAKGYNSAVGALLGLTVIGLVVIAVLPYRAKKRSELDPSSLNERASFIQVTARGLAIESNKILLTVIPSLSWINGYLSWSAPPKAENGRDFEIYVTPWLFFFEVAAIGTAQMSLVTWASKKKRHLSSCRALLAKHIEQQNPWAIPFLVDFSAAASPHLEDENPAVLQQAIGLWVLQNIKGSVPSDGESQAALAIGSVIAGTFLCWWDDVA
jgi:hypothetical protein